MNDIKNAEPIYQQKIPINFGSIHDLLVHMYFFDAKKYQKIVNKIDNPNIDKSITKDELLQSIQEYSQKWLEWVNTLDESESEITEADIYEIIILYNHNIYHRGQLTAILSMLGYKPTSLDVYNQELTSFANSQIS